jgi:hypothetical protein
MDDIGAYPIAVRESEFAKAVAGSLRLEDRLGYDEAQSPSSAKENVGADKNEQCREL